MLAEHAIPLPATVQAIEPLGYLDMQALAGAAAVLTDSGGLQKEAYWHRVPCVTLRPSTEWVDTVEAGANVLVDDDLARGGRGASFPPGAPPLYGDGHASERVAAALYASRPDEHPSTTSPSSARATSACPWRRRSPRPDAACSSSTCSRSSSRR